MAIYSAGTSIANAGAVVLGATASDAVGDYTLAFYNGGTTGLASNPGGRGTVAGSSLRIWDVESQGTPTHASFSSSYWTLSGTWRNASCFKPKHQAQGTRMCVAMFMRTA